MSRLYVYISKFLCSYDYSEVELAYIYKSATIVSQLYTSTPTLLNNLIAPIKNPKYIYSINDVTYKQYKIS